MWLWCKTTWKSFDRQWFEFCVLFAYISNFLIQIQFTKLIKVLTVLNPVIKLNRKIISCSYEFVINLICCAGIDIFLQDILKLNWDKECYSKSNISLIFDFRPEIIATIFFLSLVANTLEFN